MALQLLTAARYACADEGNVHIVQDLNTTTSGASSYPDNFVSAGNTVYFTASDPIHGRRLWKTDGTSEGTMLAADLLSEPGEGHALSLIAVGDTVFFAASREDVGIELWRTDGGLKGTRLVKDIKPGPSNSYPGEFVPFGDVLFFSSPGRLWRTDGTESGTAVVDESLYCPSAGSVINGVYVVQCTQGLYSTLGFSQSMRLLLPLAEDAVLVPLGLPGVFQSYTRGELPSFDIVVTDGTMIGTHVTSFGTGSSAIDIGAPPEYDSFGDSVAFKAPATCTNDTGYPTWIMEPWSNNPPRLLSCNHLGRMLTLHDEMFTIGIDNGIPTLFKARAGASELTAVASFPETTTANMLLGTDQLLLFTTGSDDTSSLWRTDGTSTGTRRLTTGIAPDRGAIAGNGLLFAGTDSKLGKELWRTDLSDGRTDSLDIAPGGFTSNPTNLTAADRWLFFAADNGKGRRVWRSDGARTEAVIGIPPGTEPSWMLPIGDTLYVLGVAPDQVSTLWLVDMNTNIAHAPIELGTLAISTPIRVGDSLFVQTFSADLGTDLWSFNRSTLRASVSHFTAPLSMLSNQRQLMFTTSDGVTTTLWSSDGTVSGTEFVLDVPASTYFRQIDGADVMIINEADEAGTWLLPALADDFIALSDHAFCSLDGEYDSTYYAIDCNEKTLWKGVGPTVVPILDSEDLPIEDVPTDIRRLVASGRIAYFSTFALDETSDIVSQTLWSVDRTTESVTAVFSVAGAPGTGPPSVWPSRLPHGGVIFIAPGEHGQEPWISQGTAETTRLLKDIALHAGSSMNADLMPEFVTVGDRVFFVADDGTRGAELWVYELPRDEVDSGCSCSMAGGMAGQPLPYSLLLVVLAARRFSKSAATRVR